MAKIALLVGVGDYQHGFNQLPSTIKDIEKLGEILKASHIGNFDEIIPLSNPNRTELEWAMYNLFAQKKRDDLLLFYFSGHGVKNMEGNLFFAVPETEINENNEVIPPTAVAATVLQGFMQESRCHRQVVILDCCFSGAFAKGLTAKDDGKIDIQRELGGKGRAILTSSTSVQYSFQEDESGLSLYTRYLIEGLETGIAYTNDNGWITADEAHQYASQRVKEASPAMTPQFFPVEEGYKINLAKAPLEDPKLQYRKEVQRIIEEDEGDIDFIKGEFYCLDRVFLDNLRHRLAIEEGEAKTIEKEVLQPYCQRQANIERYKEAYSMAVKQRFPLRERDKRRLKDLKGLLGLRDEDIEPIEQEFTPFVPSSVPIPKPKKDQTDTQQEINSNETQLNTLIEDLGNGITLELIKIPSGSFMMGTEDAEIAQLCQQYNIDWFNNEKPRHEVTLKAFYMGKYPVTQAQYEAVMGNNPSYFQNAEKAPLSQSWENYPVECVSWNDAQEFCRKLSQLTEKTYKLPSESQWEYACRAGSQGKYCYGDDESKLGEYAWYSANSSRQTHPVGQKKPNNWGLYDMHGNVYEWCEDDYVDNYNNTPKDGTAHKEKSMKYIVLRGGSWYDAPFYCRSAKRSRDTRDSRNTLNGFRLILVLSEHT